jgi:hypothetical protein
MQLLAAWLVGLIVTNAIFLGSAISLDKDSWERGALVISAIVNVPVFLFALFVLQTRFRAELQEDTFYSEYLSKKTATVVRIDKNASQDTKIDEIERQLVRLTTSLPLQTTANANENTSQVDWSNWPIALNHLHPNFKAIREALKSAKIPLTSIFGGSDGPPIKWIVALSYQMPVLHKAQLLETVLPFGFDGIHLWDPQRDAEENEDAYIGSYGVSTYAQVSPELIDLVKTNIDAVDLDYYVKNHQTVM